MCVCVCVIYACAVAPYKCWLCIVTGTGPTKETRRHSCRRPPASSLIVGDVKAEILWDLCPLAISLVLLHREPAGVLTPRTGTQVARGKAAHSDEHACIPLGDYVCCATAILFNSYGHHDGVLIICQFVVQTRTPCSVDSPCDLGHLRKLGCFCYYDDNACQLQQRIAECEYLDSSLEHSAPPLRRLCHRFTASLGYEQPHVLLPNCPMFCAHTGTSLAGASQQEAAIAIIAHLSQLRNG